jgi:hypothetical protein
MDYKAELEKLEADSARLIAGRNELRTKSSRAIEEGLAIKIELGKIMPENSEELESAALYKKWKLQMLSNVKYHVIARAVLTDASYMVAQYTGLLKGAIESKSPKVLKNINKQLDEMKDRAERIIAEAILILKRQS